MMDDNNFDEDLKAKGFSGDNDSNIPHNYKLTNTKKSVKSILDSMRISILNNNIIENMVLYLIDLFKIILYTYLFIFAWL